MESKKKNHTIDLKIHAALDYALRGWPVIPVHTAVNGFCSCGNPKCENPAKHPRTPHGHKDGTADLITIFDWWGQWPDSNIGIVTGAVSGLVVIDIDSPEAKERLKSLAPEYPWTTVPRVRTGRAGGGWQLWFKHPGPPIPGKVGIFPQVDVRGEDGYAIVPPSTHVTGKTYKWEVVIDE